MSKREYCVYDTWSDDWLAVSGANQTYVGRDSVKNWTIDKRPAGLDRQVIMNVLKTIQFIYI